MKYKGYEIELNEETGEFTLTVDGEDYFKHANLATVKAVVDKLVKKTFKRIRAYILGEVGYRWDKEGDVFTEIEITSINPNGDIWIIDNKKNREKYHSRMFERNGKNLEILKEIKKHKNEIAATEKKVESLEKRLDPVKLPEKEDDEG